MALVPLLDLTDEELAAVDGLPTGLVVSPYLEDLDDAARDTAVVTAFRSLVSRGVVAAPTVEQASAAGDDGVELEMLAELSQVLTLRRAAPVVVCAQQALAGPVHSWRYVHVLADEGVALDEQVAATGLHRFSLLSPQDVAAELGGWLVPDGLAVGTSDGPETAVDAQTAADGATDAALLDELGRAEVVTDVVVRRRTDDEPPVVLGVFAGRGLLVLSTTAPGEPVRVRPASAATVEAAVAALLEPGP